MRKSCKKGEPLALAQELCLNWSSPLSPCTSYVTGAHVPGHVHAGPEPDPPGLISDLSHHCGLIWRWPDWWLAGSVDCHWTQFWPWLTDLAFWLDLRPPCHYGHLDHHRQPTFLGETLTYHQTCFALLDWVLWGCSCFIVKPLPCLPCCHPPLPPHKLHSWNATS